MKRLLSLILAVMVCLSFSGCNYLLGESDNLLQAPRPDGTLQRIQKALKETSLKDGYKLKSAKSGNYRTAYILKDINGNGEQEAMVFYTVTEGAQETLNFTVLQSENDDWSVAANTTLSGTNIERVDFGDLDGDGSEEVIIAWNIYGAPETRLSVFSMVGLEPKGIFEQSYTDFCVYDMDTNGSDDLLIFTIDTIEKTSYCTIYCSSSNGLEKAGTVQTDKNAISYKNIRRSAVDGKPALFVDCVLNEGGLFTELITYQNGKLSAPLYQQSGRSSLTTKRSENIICGDANGDGVVEIPCGTVMPSGNDVQNSLSLIEWKQYSGGTLSLKERSVVSKAQQYKFLIKDEWLGKLACVATAPDGMEFYEYSQDSGKGKLLFSINAVSTESYDSESYNDWFIITQNYKTVYLAKITNEQSKAGSIDRKTVKKYFSEKIVEEG